MTYSKGSELPAPKQPDAKMKEGVQDRRCKPNVEPWRRGGRRPGHPRHRTVRHHRRPAEDLPTPGTLATSGRDRAQAVGRRTGHLGGHAGAAGLPGQTLIADKNYFGGAFEAVLAEQGVRLLRPARKGEPERAGAHLFKPLRQVIESINQTFKGQLDLERHGGHTPAGVIVRVLQRILALTAAIWHNDHTGQPTPRSLVAYDH